MMDKGNIQIRRGVFETNSSSTHAICIKKEGEFSFPTEKSWDESPIVRFHANFEFGWEWAECYDIESKAAYLYEAIVYTCDVILKEASIGEQVDYVYKQIQKIKSWLDEDNIIGYFDDLRLQLGDYTSIEAEGHIDHGDECDDFVKWVMESKEHLYAYLFNSKSYITMGNDNCDDKELVIPSKDGDYEIFYKGN